MTVHSFPLPPSANKYWRHVGHKVLVSAEAKDYKKTVAMLARCDRAELLPGPVCVTLHVYRERKAGDLDNYAKIVCDALQGIFYSNDSQIVELHLFRHEDKHDPRLELEIAPALHEFSNGETA